MSRALRIGSELLTVAFIIVGATVGTRYLSLNLELLLAAVGIIVMGTFVALRVRDAHDSRESDTTLDLRK